MVTKGASKLLDDYKLGNIVKELKKLKQKDIASLEAANTTLQSQVADLKVEMALKDEEIRQLKGQKTEALDQIREIVRNLGDALNKAHFFDKYIKKEVQVSLPKIIAILVGF